MKTGITVHDCMTTKPICIDKNSSLGEASKVMADNHVGALLVTDNDQRYGIITERDIVRKTVARNLNPLEHTVEDHSTTKLVTVNPAADIYEAIIAMRDHQIRHLPVEENGKFVGFIGVKDILKIEPQLFEIIVEKFEIMEWERKKRARQKALNQEGF